MLTMQPATVVFVVGQQHRTVGCGVLSGHDGEAVEVFISASSHPARKINSMKIMLFFMTYKIA